MIIDQKCCFPSISSSRYGIPNKTLNVHWIWRFQPTHQSGVAPTEIQQKPLKLLFKSEGTVCTPLMGSFAEKRSDCGQSAMGKTNSPSPWSSNCPFNSRSSAIVNVTFNLRMTSHSANKFPPKNFSFWKSFRCALHWWAFEEWFDRAISGLFRWL